MRSENVSRFSVSAPQKVVEEFDTTIKKIGYDRSKAIQTAMRSFLDDYKLDDIVNAMRAVVEDYPSAQKRAFAGATYIRSQQTYRHTANRIVELLK